MVSNFSDAAVSLSLQLPAELVDAWPLKQNTPPFIDLFSQQPMNIDPAAAAMGRKLRAQ